MFATAVTDFKAELRDSAGLVVYTGTIVNHASAGVYTARFTPVLVGSFRMHIMFNGLEVDQSPYSVIVNPKAVTDAVSSTITPIRVYYTTGENIWFHIEARD